MTTKFNIQIIADNNDNLMEARECIENFFQNLLDSDKITTEKNIHVIVSSISDD